MIYKRLRPSIVILFLLLCVSQMAKAENDNVVSVQTKSSDTDQTNTDEKPAGSVSDVGWPAHYGGVMLQGFYWGFPSTSPHGISLAVRIPWHCIPSTST